MEFEMQAHALLPHLLFTAGYLGILFFAERRRDPLAFALLIVFCIVLGFRDINTMSTDADPIQYAFILSYSSDVSSLTGGGIDYVLFSLLHPITGAIFDLRTCFLFLHLLFIPALYLLFKRLREYQGVFFLMTGWMIFVNSGLLMLANFFRQGLSVILLLAILVGMYAPAGKSSGKWVGILTLPFLHLSSAILIPGLLAGKRRRYFLISSAFFLLLCIAIRLVPSLLASQAGFFDGSGLDMQSSQLRIKILSIYAMIAFGYFFASGKRETSTCAEDIQRAALGLLIPTAGLLLMLDAPGIGLRFLYFSYALAFLYVALTVSLRKSKALFNAFAFAICLFGFVTWTYPTVAVLLIW